MKKLFFIIFLNLFLIANAIPINTDFFNQFNDSFFEKYIQEALENNHDLKQANYRVERFRYEISNQFDKFIQNNLDYSNLVDYSVLYESDNWTANYLRMFKELNSSKLNSL